MSEPKWPEITANRTNQFPIVTFTGKMHLMPGIYSYRFQCVIPPNVPSSVEGSIGHIRYSACLTVDIPMFQSKEFQQPFIVIKTIDLSNYPALRVSFRSTFFVCLPLKFGSAFEKKNVNSNGECKNITMMDFFRYGLSVGIFVWPTEQLNKSMCESHALFVYNKTFSCCIFTRSSD